MKINDGNTQYICITNIGCKKNSKTFSTKNPFDGASRIYHEMIEFVAILYEILNDGKLIYRQTFRKEYIKSSEMPLEYVGPFSQTFYLFHKWFNLYVTRFVRKKVMFVSLGEQTAKREGIFERICSELSKADTFGDRNKVFELAEDIFQLDDRYLNIGE